MYGVSIMKKIMSLLVAALVVAVVAGGGTTSSKEDEKVIQLSASEWKSVKDCVDTNGYCRIVGQSAVIAITNGLPNVEVIHWFPMGRGPEKLKKNNENEPARYSGQ